MRTNPKSDELRSAAFDLRRSLRRYDEAEPEDAGFTALIAEAAVRRYACLLQKRKNMLKKHDPEGGNNARRQSAHNSKR
ncbi:MAG: hypothetical protein IIT70_03480 [Clostridia bacterium]|nr:hypothetical protein [Clostridia bacterium]MBQ5487901.1 hypothetical protein [Clostridia bacterium]MBR4636126.1 hypothetical protein [Clostridia bacterium]